MDTTLESMMNAKLSHKGLGPAMIDDSTDTPHPVRVSCRLPYTAVDLDNQGSTIKGKRLETHT